MFRLQLKHPIDSTDGLCCNLLWLFNLSQSVCELAECSVVRLTLKLSQSVRLPSVLSSSRCSTQSVFLSACRVFCCPVDAHPQSVSPLAECSVVQSMLILSQSVRLPSGLSSSRCASSVSLSVRLPSVLSSSRCSSSVSLYACRVFCRPVDAQLSQSVCPLAECSVVQSMLNLSLPVRLMSVLSSSRRSTQAAASPHPPGYAGILSRYESRSQVYLAQAVRRNDRLAKVTVLDYILQLFSCYATTIAPKQQRQQPQNSNYNSLNYSNYNRPNNSNNNSPKTATRTAPKQQLQQPQ
ncbi:hypothetical protein PoB_003184400 [Plakobranchus ocellatus]|uniref:Uncharacterized protein n=1 Tax=Plakobranchus ocellatus TaxID=259542 RepID=A0AAV4AGG3_9GAST|nr:hypothetical protein PoB_003184400 [Plakobranchus ocellatus]